MTREQREKQLHDIMKNEGLDVILDLYMKMMGLPPGSTLPADLTRNSIIVEMLDHEYPPAK